VRLRSGKYMQGTGHLLFNGCYCCMGVLALCVVGDPERIPPDTGWLEVSPGGEDEGDEEFVILPKKVQYQLASMNDGTITHERKPKTFTEIADYIEENVPAAEHPRSA